MDLTTSPGLTTTFASVIGLAAEVAPASYADVIAGGAVPGDGCEPRERIGSGGMATVYRPITGRGTEAVLTLERIPDGTTLRSGKRRDVPSCTTCNEVSSVELIVLDSTHRARSRSAWGARPDRYKWLGPLRDGVGP